ncbi:MAG: glycoside hydrolase family 5 protein [Hyphomonas sp.]|nr:glycoside hydrolase family 5 protein [Hyphomonas sp.]
MEQTSGSTLVPRTSVLQVLSLGGLAALVLALLAMPAPKLKTEPVAAAPHSPIQRCMGMGGALEAPVEGAWGYTVRRPDIEAIARAGFDTIRLPVRVSAHTGTAPPYAISPDLLARMDQIVGWAIENHLNIIIDVHHFESLMTDPDNQLPRLDAIWDQLAAHYAHAPDNVIFELLNEPSDKMTVRRTGATNAELLHRIRQTNPNRWVILGTPLWGTLDGMLRLNPASDPYVITGFHYYSPFEFTHQGASWMDDPPPKGAVWGSQADYDTLAHDFDKAAAWGRDTGLPLFIGEFGVDRDVDPALRARWTRAVRTAAESRDMSWCYWDWATSFGAWNQSSGTWIEPMRSALLDKSQ